MGVDDPGCPTHAEFRGPLRPHGEPIAVQAHRDYFNCSEPV